MHLTHFHPAVSSAFFRHFNKPTEVQIQAWAAIQSGCHTLLAAPTGSGKTLAAFLAAIDTLVRESRYAPLPDETRVLYVSPLKALSNDIHKNLQQPLQSINEALLGSGEAFADITAAVRTGDTSAGERTKMRKTPPHILVTTPESLYILLTSESGRAMLQSVETVILDEIHAVAGNKRGAHLALSLERLEALCAQSPTRIGISATQKPIENMARFMVGRRDTPYTIVDTGHSRHRDLAIEITNSPLDAVMSNEVWGEIYDRLADFTQAHRTTLIFSNTRRMAERVARHLSERIGEEHVTSHHGSLSREHRLQAEQRLKSGQLKALIATASLELGIDIGDVDLVCQLGSPRSISGFLQRVGRSGHAVSATPKGRLFPLTRDDLVESIAILEAIEQGELDRIDIPQHPLDVLSQQIIAEVANREWDEGDLLKQFRHAWPYRDLSDKDWQATLKMVSEGFTTRRGRRGAYIHWDRINGKLRPRRNARLTAILNGGSIPDLFDYDVVLQPQGIKVGTLNEDFSFESLPGDIFQLGNTAYRILKIEPGRMHVEDAHGLPPTIPFWFGESPGRSDELSKAVASLRRDISNELGFGVDHTRNWLIKQRGLSPLAADQITEYLASAHAALGLLPDQENIIFERFFDEAGDMHFVVHSPYGSRLNRAWGLALRKRFCRRFNFELQAAAVEDSIVLSLGATHSFPLEEVADYLQPESVRHLLIQALLDAPMFATHWRWNACTALAIVRNRNGRRVPAPFQRADAEDLVALVFPDQLACFENIAGEREVPEHPLVDQTLEDCLTDLMDIEGLERLLQRLRDGEIKIHCRDLTGPSPLASEIINARPYAFLDDAPAEERRTLAIQNRSFASPEDAGQLAKLDPAAISQVKQEAWPETRDADELHDALVVYGFLTEGEGRRSLLNPAFLDELIQQKRATTIEPADGLPRLWVAAERLHELLALAPEATQHPAITALEADTPDRDTAIRELLRSRLEALGPTTEGALGKPLGLSQQETELGLLALEQEGFVLRGNFTGEHPEEWCERRLLARIHRYTLQTLRKEIKPVSPAAFMRFLFHWHGLNDPGEGNDALLGVLQQLEGCSIAAAAWEKDILPARLRGYQPQQLDQLCSSGQIIWLHPNHSHDRKAAPLATTGIVLLERATQQFWQPGEQIKEPDNLSSPALRLYRQLQQGGADFFFDLVQKTGLLRTQVEEAL
ncbi:MAG TPA: DEAD/DEAH box helicase, partial [Gammaproteobacteria bacterium]|nr:DEAD/DEAH box helicase [Gammaproteobacteria bacterium]